MRGATRVGHFQLVAGVIVIFAAYAAFLGAGRAMAVEPTKWIFNFEVGRNTDQTKVDEPNTSQEERNECTAVSRDLCATSFGNEGTGPREFIFVRSVAVSKSTGNVYAGDVEHRIQVLGPRGEFLYMFGWNVNKTKLGLGAAASQEEKNVCTAASGNECGEGEQGTGLAGQIGVAESLAIDPSTGNIYMFDPVHHRLDEYSAAGEFILMIGGNVNRQGGNVCPKAEEQQCQAGVEGSGHLAFDNLQSTGYGNQLSFGGAQNHLYVADSGRVQEMETDGTWVHQITIPGEALAVAVNASGDMFVADSAGPGVHVYNTEGELQPCVIDSTSTGIRGLALDSYQQLGVSELSGPSLIYGSQGAKCDQLVTEVTVAGSALSFSAHENAKNEAEDLLYAANENLQKIESYSPLNFPEVETTRCTAGTVGFTDAELCGEIDPKGVSALGFFKYGTQSGALAFETPGAALGEGTSFEQFAFELSELTPNQEYYYQAWVEAEGGGVAQRQAAPKIEHFRTRGPPPVIEGAPRALFVTDLSADLNATLNPEHALTKYHFEYARCESEAQPFAACDQPQSTSVLSSETYGAVGVTQELLGLASDAVYAYRLVAENDFEMEGRAEGGRSVGAEGHFTTESTPVPAAVTGGAGVVTATGAVISGAVNTGGPAATYLFELGVYAGANTQYGIVFSGPVTASAQPSEEQLALSGLQSATTYAYRIAVESGYISNAGETHGETRTFTTGGVPALLASPPAPALLEIPSDIHFPEAGKQPPRKPLVKCKRGFERDKQNKCVKRKRAKRTGRSGKKAGARGTASRR